MEMFNKEYWLRDPYCFFADWQKLVKVTINTIKQKVNIYVYKFNNKNARKKCEICSELIIKTTKWGQWRCCLCWCLCYFWTYFTPLSKVYIVDFEQVTAYWAFRTLSISPEFFQPQPQQQKIYIKICSSHFAAQICLGF